MQIEALNSLLPKKETTETNPQKENKNCNKPEPEQSPYKFPWLEEFWVLVNGGIDYADDIGVDLTGLDFSRWSGAKDLSPGNIEYGGNINGSKSKLNLGFSLSTIASISGLEDKRKAATATLLVEYEEQLESKQQALENVKNQLQKTPNNQNLLEQKAILEVDINDLEAKILALSM